MHLLKIPLPSKNPIYLDFDVDECEEKLIGDKKAIEFLKHLFLQAEKEKITYSWMEHGYIYTSLITKDDITNCDAIRAVLIHNKIEVPDNFPSGHSRFIQVMNIDGDRIIF
ncbi:hypothetical protein [Gallibacterium anatis]|uniref:hypothetical protein n=1 Tax=Gallibacterium anatis TaxID=750 RepID=UPI000B9FA6C1|nr:hypothetical protein [Gallibacterium anatis]OZN49370.1 hypothetical protein CF595_05250 [Gallibacterium anatis]